MKNLQKGFIVPLLSAIIALLVIGGGGYFYVQNKNIKNTEEGKIVATTTQVITDSPKVIKCNLNNFAPGTATCNSDMSSLDLERENKAIEILAKEKIIELTSQRYFHGELLVSHPQYQVVSLPGGPRFGYVIVDIINKKVTDKFSFGGSTFVFQDDKRIILSNLNLSKTVSLTQYVYGTEKSIPIPNTDITEPQTYLNGLSGETNNGIRILASTTNSITLGIYDKTQATPHPEVYWTDYKQIGTKVIDLSVQLNNQLTAEEQQKQLVLDITIKPALGNFKGDVAAYANENGGIYDTKVTSICSSATTGVFTDFRIKTIIDHVTSKVTSIDCRSTPSTAAVSVVLKGAGTRWCVDSRGNMVEAMINTSTGLCK